MHFHHVEIGFSSLRSACLTPKMQGGRDCNPTTHQDYLGPSQARGTALGLTSHSISNIIPVLVLFCEICTSLEGIQNLCSALLHLERPQHIQSCHSTMFGPTMGLGQDGGPCLEYSHNIHMYIPTCQVLVCKQNSVPSSHGWPNH